MNSETVDDQCINDNLHDSLPPSIEEIENEGKDFDRESKRPRGTTSKVWDHFTKICVKNGKERAKCKSCGVKYVTGGTKIGTLTMLHHLSKCVVLKKLKDNDVGKMITKYCSSILPENETLILTQNWLHGFELTGNIIVCILKLI